MITMAEQESRTRLSDLVADRRAALRISLAKLAEACVDPETGIQEWKVGRLHRLEHRQPIEAPTAAELRALAAGLKLPPRDVQDAVGEQFLGVETVKAPHSDRVRLLANRASNMTPEQVEQLIAIAETFPVRREGQDETK